MERSGIKILLNRFVGLCFCLMLMQPIQSFAGSHDLRIFTVDETKLCASIFSEDIGVFSYTPNIEMNRAGTKTSKDFFVNINITINNLFDFFIMSDRDQVIIFKFCNRIMNGFRRFLSYFGVTRDFKIQRRSIAAICEYKSRSNSVIENRSRIIFSLFDDNPGTLADNHICFEGFPLSICKPRDYDCENCNYPTVSPSLCKYKRFPAWFGLIVLAPCLFVHIVIYLIHNISLSFGKITIFCCRILIFLVLVFWIFLVNFGVNVIGYGYSYIYA